MVERLVFRSVATPGMLTLIGARDQSRLVRPSGKANDRRSGKTALRGENKVCKPRTCIKAPRDQRKSTTILAQQTRGVEEAIALRFLA
jgi:hypothetical protein